MDPRRWSLRILRIYLEGTILERESNLNSQYYTVAQEHAIEALKAVRTTLSTTYGEYTSDRFCRDLVKTFIPFYEKAKQFLKAQDQARLLFSLMRDIIYPHTLEVPLDNKWQKTVKDQSSQFLRDCEKYADWVRQTFYPLYAHYYGCCYELSPCSRCDRPIDIQGEFFCSDHAEHRRDGDPQHSAALTFAEKESGEESKSDVRRIFDLYFTYFNALLLPDDARFFSAFSGSYRQLALQNYVYFLSRAERRREDLSQGWEQKEATEIGKEFCWFFEHVATHLTRCGKMALFCRFHDAFFFRLYRYPKVRKVLDEKIATLSEIATKQEYREFIEPLFVKLKSRIACLNVL